MGEDGSVLSDCAGTSGYPHRENPDLPMLQSLSHLSDPSLSLSLFLSPREEQEAEYILNPDLMFPLSPWRSVH